MPQVPRMFKGIKVHTSHTVCPLCKRPVPPRKMNRHMARKHPGESDKGL